MMNENVCRILNAYLEAELGDSLHLPTIEDFSRQRENFLARFGPEQLAKMSSRDLLQALPLNQANEEPMDYWLEFKNDDEFATRDFGSIVGGSMAKYGTWQDKETGAWRVQRAGSRPVVDISEEEALEILEGRRREMLNAAQAVRIFQSQSLEAVDPKAFQSAIEEAAPRWKTSAWLHKYLHLNFPERVTWTATMAYSNAELYRLGMEPGEEGIYGQDIRVIQFWSTMPALQDLPIPLRYRVGKGLRPRNHWSLVLNDDPSALDQMLSDGSLSFGPAKSQSLARANTLDKKADIQLAIQTALRESGQELDSYNLRNLTELLYGVKEGDIITLFADTSTAIAAGEVVGGYDYKASSERPHRVKVRWYHARKIHLSTPLRDRGYLQKQRSTHPVVAEIERSLLLTGIGPWKNFSKAATKPAALPPKLASTYIDAGKVDLPPPEEIARHVMEMLERKRQVILYGPPGTGKTYHADKIALELVARQNFNALPELLTSRQIDAIYGRDGSEPYIATCTFHPLYSYEDFIEGYRPDGEGFTLEPGIFKRMAQIAQAQPDEHFVLIIDEINRGNIPKIFGELITLIEASKRGEMSAILPLSKEAFTVPDNLFVIGTMNTADRSILLLDTALRRRFAFKELLPDPGLLNESAIEDVKLSTWLRALNRRIVEQLGRDGRNLQIGHAYLMPGGKPATTLSRIGQIIRDEIWPLLQEYCYEDSNKLANILAADRGGIYDRDKDNLRFELFEPENADELAKALIALITAEDAMLDEKESQTGREEEEEQGDEDLADFEMGAQ